MSEHTVQNRPSVLREALKEFYDAADHKHSQVVLATAAEVFQAAEDASKKLQTPTHTMDFLLKLGPCLESMKRFSGIIDIFAQSDPAISASVWGCLKLLFLSALSVTNCLEKLADMFEEIGRFCPLASEYEAIFNGSEHVHVTVSLIYADIVRCCAKAMKVIVKRPRTIVLRAVIKPFEYDYSLVLHSLQKHRYDLQVNVLLEIEKSAQKERTLSETVKIETQKERQDAAKDRRRADKERNEAKKERQEAAKDRSLADTERNEAKRERQEAAENYKRADEEWIEAQKERQEAAEDRKRAGEERAEAQKERQEAAEDRKRAGEERAEAQKQRQAASEALQRDEGAWIKSQKKTERQRKELDEATSFCALMSWLNPPDYESIFHRIARQRYGGTVTWFEKTRPYLIWRQMQPWKGEFLWIYGSPGMGKTVLAATLIEDLKTQLQQPTRKSSQETPFAICFFFFDPSNGLEKPVIAMLKCFIAQMLHQTKDATTKTKVFDSSTSSYPTIITLREIFGVLAKTFYGVYVVVDGLDEGNEAVDSLNLLLAMSRQVSPLMKLLVTSRPDTQIRKFFASSSQFELTKELTGPDIRDFVTRQVDATVRPRSLRPTDPRLRKEIIDTLVSGSSGSFLWVNIQLKHLQTLRSQSDSTLRAALRNVPNGSACTYSQALEGINSYSNEDRILVEQLLKWVVCARRPLKVSEVCCALAVKTGKDVRDWDDIPANPEELLNGCGQLLQVDETKTVNLIHSNIASFLLNPYNRSSSSATITRYFVQGPEAQAKIAEKCVTYLSLDSFRDRISKSEKLEQFTTEEMATYPLFEYATLNWWKHVALATQSRVTAQRLVSAIAHFAKSTQSLTCIEASITQLHTMEHFNELSQDLTSWLDGLDFRDENVLIIRDWLDGILELARRWEPVLRKDPFELRSTVLKFFPKGHIFSTYSGPQMAGKIKPPQKHIMTSSTTMAKTFDTLVDEEQGFVFHTMHKAWFRYTWTLEIVDRRYWLLFTVTCQSPLTRRKFKELSFAHEISQDISKDYRFGLHTVTFSPEWDYMAIATVEYSRVLQGEPFRKAVIRTFLWRLGDFNAAGDEIFFGVPWTSNVEFDGKVYGGLVDETCYSAFHGSRCSIAFHRCTSLCTPKGAYEITTGNFIPPPAYFRRVISSDSLSQATFSANGRKIATVKDGKEVSVANLDGTSICTHKIDGCFCEIVSFSATGWHLALCFTDLTRTQVEKIVRLAIFDLCSDNLQIKLQGIQEKRFDEVSFGLRGWLSWRQWNEQGRYTKFVPQGHGPICPDRHCIVVDSILNWLVGGPSSCLYHEVDIDYELNPSEQRWELSRPISAPEQKSVSSSASYLFIDRTFRLEDGSFLVAFGFSPNGDSGSILLSKQQILLPSSIVSPAPTRVLPANGPVTRPPNTVDRLPGNPNPPTTSHRGNRKCRTFTRLFNNNMRLGCLQITESENDTSSADDIDNRLQTVPQNISAQILIWDLSEPPQLIRDQALNLIPDDKEKIRRQWYRRFDIAFHPSCDRVALFSSIYYLNPFYCKCIRFNIFSKRELFPQSVRDGITKNSWKVSFSSDGQNVAFALTASTRAPGLYGMRGTITNAIILFSIDNPSIPLRTIDSTIVQRTLSMGACSVTFHPSEPKLLWTSMFVFSDKRTQTVTKLWNYGDGDEADHLITKLKYDDFEFSTCGHYIYAHPPRNAQCGFWDQFNINDIRDKLPRSDRIFSFPAQLGGANEAGLAPEPTNRMVMNEIYLAGRSHANEVVGIIPRDNGNGGIDFFQKTVLQLLPTMHHNLGCIRLLMPARDHGAVAKCRVILYNGDGKTMDNQKSVYGARPIVISVGMDELARREVRKLGRMEVPDVFPVMIAWESTAAQGTLLPAGLAATSTQTQSCPSLGQSHYQIKQEEKPCVVCGKPGRHCMSCKRVAYCGKEHQKQDWDKHKKVCKEKSKV